MNNDLISREALKKKIDEVQYTQEFCIEHQIDYSISMQMLGMVIDNAPTVFSCNACKNMGNEWECRDCHDYSNYIHYEERPQAEWKLHEMGMIYYCSNCGHYCDESGDNYCGNCGAYMKGGAE